MTKISRFASKMDKMPIRREGFDNIFALESVIPYKFFGYQIISQENNGLKWNRLVETHAGNDFAVIDHG